MATKLPETYHLPLVSHQLDLFIRLSFHPDISFTSTSLAVLALKYEVCDDASAEQEQRQVCQHNTVTKLIAWFVLSTVDVACNDAIQVSPTDHETERYASLVDAFCVIRAPGDSICDGGIYACRSKEGTSVLDSRSVIRGTKQHSKAHDAQDRDADVAPSASSRAVREPSDGYC